MLLAKRFFPICMLVAASTAIQIGCSGANPFYLNPLIGGPCSYSTYNGNATVTALNQGTDGYWMIFDTTISGAQPTSSLYTPKGNSVWAKNPNGTTDTTWLTSQGITIGANFSVTVSIINSGSCTPVIYKFPALSFI
jgi:hypothetical protein